MEKEKDELLNIKSEEVQEILGTPPKWLIRWGTTIAFITFLAIGWASYFLQYNDTIDGNIEVSSTDPAQVVRAEDREQISRILVNHEDSVQAGQYLLSFKSRANIEDILSLESSLLMVDAQNDSALLALKLPTDLILGEIEDDYYDFANTQELVRLERSGNNRQQSIRTLEKEVSQSRRAIRNEKKKKANLLEQIGLVERRYQRESNMLKQNLIGASQVEKTKEDLLALERMLKTIDWNIKNNEFAIGLRRDEINGVERGSEESRIAANIQLRESFGRLVRNLEDWKKQYAIASPVNGIVLFSESIGEQQYVFGGTELFKIVPTDIKTTRGKLSLKVKGSGRVEVGQKVLVKLENYPFPEFGAVEGQVARIGIISGEDGVPVEITFPQGMITTNGRQIESKKTMRGTATIIVEEKRFIERIFEQAKALLI
ncbi:MAG: HlyD family efflux transporter periplasmic adaptor subunit [Bacteroidota bacterium]